MKYLRMEKSSFFFCPMWKGGAWNVTKEWKPTRLIYSTTGLAKMVATWKDGDISLFFFSSNLSYVSESLSTSSASGCFPFYYMWVCLDWCLIHTAVVTGCCLSCCRVGRGVGSIPGSRLILFGKWDVNIFAVAAPTPSRKKNPKNSLILELWKWKEPLTSTHHPSSVYIFLYQPSVETHECMHM